MKNITATEIKERMSELDKRCAEADKRHNEAMNKALEPMINRVFELIQKDSLIK